MTKYMIASDLHGSFTWVCQLMRQYELEGAKQLIFLGDILYHGPRNDLPDGYAPKKVIELLNSYKEQIICVRGNCDAQVDQMVLDFDLMSDCQGLGMNGVNVMLTHGHDMNIDTLVDHKAKISGCEVLLYGHTHIPIKCKSQGIWCLNPGSVSIPKNGSCHSYMVMEDQSFIWKDMDGRVYDRLDLL